MLPFLRFGFLIPVVLTLFFACGNTVEFQEALTFVNLFDSDSLAGNACYRIPALLKAQNGNLIAAIDERLNSCNDLRGNRDINIVIRISEDNGMSWSPMRSIVDYPIGQSASDPSMILDEQTGEIFLFYNYMDLDESISQYYLKYVSSTDNGITWSQPIDITDQISLKEWSDDFKFITSGKGTQTRDGLLLHTLVNLEHGLHVFGSDDHGENWFLINTPIQPGDESKIIELNNGNWMVNSRVNNRGVRYIHLSADNGQNWQSFPDSNLVDPACNASLIRYTSVKDGYQKNRILFANLDASNKRENLSIKISYDEGETWSYRKTIYAGEAAYSSLAILEDGSIGVFFEKDNYRKNVFARFSLAWLTDGSDTLEPR